MKKISYLGPRGTFTEEALFSFYKDAGEITAEPLGTIVEVIKSIDRGDTDEGLIPIENSLEGSVNITQDILAFESEAKIIREITIPIRHYLIGKKDTGLKKVRKVISHPHATAQCRSFLNNRLPGAEIIAANSTAEAVKKILDLDDDFAAIGTRVAAEFYDLKIIEKDIEDSRDNKTRFVFISNYIPQRTGHDKTSIVCFLKKDKPGSLYKILKEFADRGINLTKIESRPARKNIGDYIFMIDLEGHLHEKKVFEGIESLRQNVYMIKILGSYPVWKES
jgi:prephenate dehydratase